MDFNLKKLANFFKFFLCILEKLRAKNRFIVCSSLKKSVDIFLPVLYEQFYECKYMEHIFELRIKDQIEERSSQLLRNLSSCEKKA